jgi:hypothetical protein
MGDKSEVSSRRPAHRRGLLTCSTRTFHRLIMLGERPDGPVAQPDPVSRGALRGGTHHASRARDCDELSMVTNDHPLVTLAETGLAAVNSWGKLGHWGHAICYKRTEVGPAVSEALLGAEVRRESDVGVA